MSRRSLVLFSIIALMTPYFFYSCKSQQRLYLESNSKKIIEIFYFDLMQDLRFKLFKKLMEAKPSLTDNSFDVLYGEKEDGSWEIDGNQKKVFDALKSLAKKCGKPKEYKITKQRYVVDGTFGTKNIFFNTAVIWQHCHSADFLIVGYSIDDKARKPKINLYAYSPKLTEK